MPLDDPHPPPTGILVTRPEPGAAETARRLAALGWDPVEAPALQLAPRPLVAPEAAQALLLTSRAAVPALANSALPRTMPVLTVGAATAEAARAAGFANVIAADGDAAALETLVAARLVPAAGPLLLAVGAGYAQDLALALRRRGFRVLRRIAYAAAPAPDLPDPARAALREGRVVAALFFSPRSAQCAIALIRQAGLAATTPALVALALSPRVAAALSASPLAWRAVRVADRPDQDSLLQLLGPR
ncbi:uroporphyrinogen-III synthase [Belnapia sp. T6]|uniref:Uroporphyrinogen-III synthase n=1 Tax=Belnapia mucosa TaxID=2804532 RepID=A0ABS1UWS9_9PROT|nr:uroporphyrinogen-III synthase [Belnapia mucosa]MBL6453931.1 uroporphyrinogen-III synthase [Belnapia mucosa]